MAHSIKAKTLRKDLGLLLHRVKKGARFTVLYRSHPICQIIPVEGGELAAGDLKDEPLYRAKALGRSSDRRKSALHDGILYGV